MKKLFTLLVLVSAFIGINANCAKAQTSVDLLYGGDSSFTANCSLPDTVDLYFYGNTSGYSFGDSLNMQISFGDGTDTTFYIRYANGTNFFIYGSAQHVYTLPGAYAAQFIATASDGKTDTFVDYYILVAAQCADISGKLYLDANSNCLYNAGEINVSSYVTASYNGQIIAMTLSDSSGNYFLSVPDGFTYVIAPGGTFAVTCPGSGSYTVSSFPATGKDFAGQCNAQSDLTGNIYGQGFRNNSNTTVWIRALNQLLSCIAPTATVTITLDPKLSYVSSSETPTSISSSQVVFNAGQLSGLNQGGFTSTLTLHTDISASLGDTLCLTLTVDPQTGDANPADNVITICMPVRNSCDPNEKYEIHAGAGTANVLPGTELAYTIMFQNVGNDDAFNIDVIDELDANLDLSTLKITGFSYEPVINIVNNTMKFEFNNINLPAASVNEPQSHGFVSYKIKPKTGTALGTAIENTAKIYFDFNAPIITNTVTDVIALSTGVNSIDQNNKLVLFPNPAYGYFTVTTGSALPALLTIYDITGRTVISKQEVADKQIISTKNLNSGMYFVTLLSNGIKHTGKLTVK